jgi:hypothetical protein
MSSAEFVPLRVSLLSVPTHRPFIPVGQFMTWATATLLASSNAAVTIASKNIPRRIFRAPFVRANTIIRH